jgi:hypothetical protein
MFCIDQGEYKFDSEKLKARFALCEMVVRSTLASGADCVVANTFVLKEYIDKYIAIAQDCNASYELCTIVSEHKSIHSVPEIVIENMRAKWEAVPGEVFSLSDGLILGRNFNRDEFEFTSSLQKHQEKVKRILGYFIADELKYRAARHDRSKLSVEEKSIFVSSWKLLKEGKKDYLGDAYKKALEALSPALKHHYGVNDHHPEHFLNGVQDMSCFQIFEMLSDWFVSSGMDEKENSQEALHFLISKNSERFKIPKDLSAVLLNTLTDIENLNRAWISGNPDRENFDCCREKG